MKKPNSSKEYRPGDTHYLRSLIESAGVSQRELARMIGVNERTIRSWLSGKNEYPYLIQYILENYQETEETAMPILNEVKAESGLTVDVEYAHFMWSAASWVASSALRAGNRPKKDAPMVCDDLPDLDVILHTIHEPWNPCELELEVRRKEPTEHPGHIKVRCHFNSNSGMLCEGAIGDEIRISKKMRSAPSEMSTGIAKEVGLRHFARFVTEITHKEQYIMTTLPKISAVVVGRHQLTGDEGLVEVSRISENLPTSSKDVVEFLRKVVFPQADALGAAVVFQAVPGQLAVALAKIASDSASDVAYAIDPQSGCTVRGYNSKYSHPRLGVIISVPGQRPSGVEREFYFSDEIDERGYSPATLASSAVLFANPRAQVKVVEPALRVMVDQPMPFIFSHIEWIA